MKAMFMALVTSGALLAAPARAQPVAGVSDGGTEKPREPIIPPHWQKPALALAYAAAPPVAYYGSDAANSFWPVVPAWLLAPSVHWASRRGWRAGISLVMQPVAVYTGWMMGIAATRPSCANHAEFDCGHEDAATGMLAGYVAWAVADVVLVSDAKPRPMIEESPPPMAWRRQLHLTPVAGVTKDGQLIGGVSGRF